MNDLMESSTIFTEDELTRILEISKSQDSDSLDLMLEIISNRVKYYINSDQINKFGKWLYELVFCNWDTWTNRNIMRLSFLNNIFINNELVWKAIYNDDNE